MRFAEPRYYDDADMWTREDHRAKAFDLIDFTRYRTGLRDDQKDRMFAEAQVHATLALSAPSAKDHT